MTNFLALATDSIQVVWLNTLLSIDNAIMIALACRSLPERQRYVCMSLGAVGAVVLRVIFTLLVARLLDVPGLRLAGGLCVVYLAVKLPFQANDPPKVEAKRTLFSAVSAIVITDAMLSLDNSLALAAAARGSRALIIFGLLSSAPLIVFGARLLSSLIARLPILIWVGAVILGWAGGELIAGDPAWLLLKLSSPSEFWIGATGSVLVLAAAGMRMKHQVQT